MTSEAIDQLSASAGRTGSIAVSLTQYAAGHGHPEFPCLSSNHPPSSRIPCVDFSPWLRERVRWRDADGVCEYWSQVLEANPGVGGSREYFRQSLHRLATTMLHLPLDRHLAGGSADAYLDLRVALVELSVHEPFTPHIMTGEAPDFMAAVMAPHALSLRETETLVERRNRFVERTAGEIRFWSSWPRLTADRLCPPAAAPAEPLRRVLAILAALPLGARAHAVDAMRYLSGDPLIPRTIVSLSREVTRRCGLDPSDSTRRILASGVVLPSRDVRGWLGGWTRRDLLRFLSRAGAGGGNSWSKERLIDVAERDCAGLLQQRMADSGTVELAPEHVEGARQLWQFVRGVRETWSVWLGFGTGLSGG